MFLTPERSKPMMDHQVRVCKAFLNRTSASLNVKIPMEDFVSRVFMLHRRLIERWNGWYYHTEPVLVENVGHNLKIARQCWSSFVREVSCQENGWCVRFEIWDRQGTAPFLLHSCALSSKILEKKYMSEYGNSPLELKHSEYILRLGYRETRANYVLAPIRVGQRIPPVALRALAAASVPTALLHAWENLFQRLGELAWVGKVKPIACTLSCAPISFLRLGHYGENSCYKNGGGHDYSKLWLAADCPDSFVLLFHRGDKDSKPVKPKKGPPIIKVAGRGWGIAMPERGAFVSNFYLLQRDMVLLPVRRAIGEGLGVQNPDWVSSSSRRIRELLQEAPSLYLNEDSGLVTDVKSKVKLRMLHYYLEHIVLHAANYGLYSFRGHGPTDFNPWRGKVPSIWPYADATTEKLTRDAIEKYGNSIVSH